ncbi:hypothetical protein LZQ00_01035 [Sphingobacterium sp. SRCM116780]|uniref:hypothetical protein n=1 Tax=Sphingobacterium sp. SRCM116780 TaxID=2907623 RepID=UPI001F189D07|nr:hypothetical protein [Sphingobacterium sp. SRCM116780]UIR56417.1 hypothetical protein LZQ00_01035 [Sphingobacterium sp. SRCM116780]
MKKEELEQLKAKYLAGETSLAEEKLLKEHREDAYFSVLGEQGGEEMNLDFEQFLATAEEKIVIHQLPKRNLWKILSSIAAAVLLICLGVWYFPNNKNTSTEHERISQTKPLKEVLKDDVVTVKPVLDTKENTEKVSHRLAQFKKHVPKKHAPVLVPESENQVTPQEFYVEVNGVKITNEAEALQITEEALQFASLNLKKGMKEVENIKCLNIEL